MANSSAIGFGLKPIRAYGNGYESMGLGEYPVAASSDAMFFQDLIVQAASGYVTVGVAGTENILGSLNGVFFTDASTSKPTFANHLDASNTATDIVGFVSDDPYERFEIQSDNSTASAQTDVFMNYDILYAAGDSANYVSNVELDDSSLSSTSGQLRVVGVSKDINNNDLSTSNVNFVVMINEHFLKTQAGV